MSIQHKGYIRENGKMHGKLVNHRLVLDSGIREDCLKNLHLLLARLARAIPAHIEYLFILLLGLYGHWHIVIRCYNLAELAYQKRHS